MNADTHNASDGDNDSYIAASDTGRTRTRINLQQRLISNVNS